MILKITRLTIIILVLITNISLGQLYLPGDEPPMNTVKHEKFSDENLVGNEFAKGWVLLDGSITTTSVTDITDIFTAQYGINSSPTVITDNDKKYARLRYEKNGSSITKLDCIEGEIIADSINYTDFHWKIKFRVSDFVSSDSSVNINFKVTLTSGAQNSDYYSLSSYSPSSLEIFSSDLDRTFTLISSDFAVSNNIIEDPQSIIIQPEVMSSTASEVTFEIESVYLGMSITDDYTIEDCLPDNNSMSY